jgi:maltoporin
MDFSVQANATIFAHKNFHPVVEASFQGRKDGDLDMGTAIKFSVVPTLVPTGELSTGARPHFKLIYSMAIYNDAAKEQALSGYLQRVGASANTGSNIGQYIGARTDWYF